MMSELTILTFNSMAAQMSLGVILGIIIGIAITRIWRSLHSRRYRIQLNVPDVIGTWRCQWFDDAKDTKEPKIEDTIEIIKWIEKGEFIARGYQPQFHLRYPLTGEIDASRVVTLSYRAARYPYEPNRGVACMQLSRDGKIMEGKWYGRRYSGELGGGFVRCHKVDVDKTTT